MDPLDLHSFLDLIDEGFNVVPLYVTLQLDRAGDATVMVMSDHGFAAFDRAVNLNTWLLREGFLSIDHPRAAGRDRCPSAEACPGRASSTAGRRSKSCVSGS